jgi:hypothetical protein
MSDVFRALVAKLKRARSNYIYIGTLIIFAILVLIDPDAGFIQHLPFGAGLVSTLALLLRGCLACSLVHITRKALLDYPEASMRQLGSLVVQKPEAAGLYAISISLQTLAYAIIFAVALYA